MSDFLLVTEIDARGRIVLVERLWEIASDLGTLRRSGGPEWILDRAGASVDVCLNLLHRSAAELHASGVDLDTAIDLALARGERVRRVLGDEVDE